MTHLQLSDKGEARGQLRESERVSQQIQVPQKCQHKNKAVAEKEKEEERAAEEEAEAAAAPEDGMKKKKTYKSSDHKGNPLIQMQKLTSTATSTEAATERQQQRQRLMFTQRAVYLQDTRPPTTTNTRPLPLLLVLFPFLLFSTLIENKQNGKLHECVYVR